MLLWVPFAIQSAFSFLWFKRSFSALLPCPYLWIAEEYSVECLSARGISRFVWERLSGCGHLLLRGISPGSLIFLHLWAASEKDGVRICSALNSLFRFFVLLSAFSKLLCFRASMSKPSCPAHDHAWTLGRAWEKALMRWCRQSSSNSERHANSLVVFKILTKFILFLL